MVLCLQAWPTIAIAGSLVTQPNPLDFGMVSVSTGQDADTVEITNSGSATTVNGFSLGAGCTEFTVQALSGLPVELGAAETLVVTVSYDPVDRIADSCAVTVQSSGSGGEFSVQGDGSASVLTTLTSNLNFMTKHWNAGPVEVLNVSIRNDGEESIGAANLVVLLASGAHYSVGEVIGLPISTGEVANIPVSFVPTSAGAKSDTLTIAVDNDTVTDLNDTVSLNGTATELPEPLFEDGFE